MSDKPRWWVISCYSLQSNLAYSKISASWKTPVEIVPDEAILEWDTGSLSNNDFRVKEYNLALKETGWVK